MGNGCDAIAIKYAGKFEQRFGDPFGPPSRAHLRRQGDVHRDGDAELGARLRRGRGVPAVRPSPATVAISTLLKAGESVFQQFSWTKTVFHALIRAQPLFHALFSVKTLSGTLFAPPQKQKGYGARSVCDEPRVASPLSDQ